MTEPAALRETSSATTRLVLGYVREARGDDAVARVLAAADVPESLPVLEDESSWVSYDTRIRLFEAIAAEFGDPRVLFDIGGSLLRRSVTPSLGVLLRALGSPAQVYRTVPKAVAKFSTTSTMTVVEVGATHATVDFRLHDGYAHSRLDCLYAQGLLTNVPSLFGLPPARVVHPECESDGAPACVYHLTWSRFRRWRRRQVGSEAHDLRGQLEQLQSAATDLTRSDELDDALRRITERAASSVLAQGYLLTVTPPAGGPLVHSVGLSPAQRDALVPQLLSGADLGPSAVVVDVVSARRRYGRLAALYAEGQTGLPDERSLLAAYAGHAAAALDLLIALEDSRRDEDRARTLLELSHRLAGTSSTEEVVTLVSEALPSVVGCDSAGVLLWHPADGELRTAASVGLTEQAQDVLRATALRPQETPELTAMLTCHAPMVLSAGTCGPALRALLDAVGVEHLVAVPLLSGDELLGVATASWGPGPAPADRTHDLTQRLQGVADQAATALRNTELLATVRHQALHDALTGLPNRVLFVDRLEQSLADRPTAVLFCDLDRFKQVNDALGHAAGDELLRQVAGRLGTAVPAGASVGRLSGDEFAVLLPGTSAPAAEQVAQDVVACFDEAFRLDGREVRTTTSVGVAQSAPDGTPPDRLLRAADAAMYVAKQRGRNQVCSAAPGPAPATGAGTTSLQQELREGIAAGQLRLLYQPVVAAPSREVTGVEALVRWEHPRLGRLPPTSFVPLAEESGLVVDLDLWVLREATRVVAGWPDARRRVAVNLASATLASPRLLPAARAALAGSGLPPDRLTLEVVESRSLVDVPGVVERLVALRRLGVRVALDDFGTGFSTLALLRDLPVDVVKVDRSFVARLGEGERGAALVRGVLALARELDLEVVAEGVETEEQLAALQDAGCGLVQGYLLGRPEPAPPALPAQPDGSAYGSPATRSATLLRMPL